MILSQCSFYQRLWPRWRAVGQTKREVSRLESEVANLRKKTGEGEDDVLALLN